MEQDLFEFAIPPVPEVRLPKPAFDPRFYQSEAVDNAFEAWDSGAVGCLLVQATGTGKTATGCFIVKRWLEQGPDYRVLVVLHERPLFYQFSDDIEKILRVTPGLEAGADHRLQLPIPKIVVAMRQSLVDRVRNGQIVSRLGKYDTDKKYLLILDEAHRYKKGLKQVAPILERFTDARRLLLTATPERGDKVSLASLGEVVVADYPHTSLDGRPSACGDGFVVDFEQHFVTINSVDLQKVKGHKSKDWSAEDLSDKLSQVRALDEIIQPSLDIVQDKRSLVFCVDRAMSRALVDRINHKYIPGAARWIDATLPMEERKEILAAHKANEFQFLCVVGLCREGYNDPYIEAVVCARPTKSASLAEQMKGRGCRVLPGVIDGLETREERLDAIKNSDKDRCIVVDLVGATGLAGNQTVASILAKGLPDHLVDLVTERANLLAKEASTELSLKEIVEKTAEDLLEEDRIAEEMVERERLRYIENQIDAARLAGLTLDVDYTSKIVDQGEGTVLKFRRPEMRVSNGKYKGKLLSRVPTGYIEFMITKLKPGWYRSKFQAELKYRRPQL